MFSKVIAEKRVTVRHTACGFIPTIIHFQSWHKETGQGNCNLGKIFSKSASGYHITKFGMGLQLPKRLEGGTELLPSMHKLESRKARAPFLRAAKLPLPFNNAMQFTIREPYIYPPPSFPSKTPPPFSLQSTMPYL